MSSIIDQTRPDQTRPDQTSLLSLFASQSTIMQKSQKEPLKVYYAQTAHDLKL